VIFEIGADFRKLLGLITHERTPISYLAFAQNGVLRSTRASMFRLYSIFGVKVEAPILGDT
jgi:hypothetical protein